MRRNVENWTVDDILRMTEQSITYAKKHNLRVIYITEDTTRTHPALLEKLYLTAASCGADWINICDTVGHVTPDGIYALIQFIRNSLNENGYQHVHIDFHGHMDRGLGLWNSIAALAAGAKRVQACALGIGERCGNTPMEQLLVNLKLMRWLEGDLKNLTAYVEQVAKAFHIEIPSSSPVVGENAFLTATGVHAAAIAKASEKKQYDLAENIYSSVPASWIGRENEIKIGPLSGKWNVIYWFKKNNIPYTDAMINILLAEAKRVDKIMTDKQILTFIKNYYQRSEHENFIV